MCKKTFKDMTLRERFDHKLLSDDKYIKAYSLDKTTFSKLMSGRVTGTKTKNKDGNTAKIIARLKLDGIWLGPLPWEK